MKLLGFEITRPRAKALASVAENRGGWFPIVRESYPGAWQHNVTVERTEVLSFHAVFACQTLIASDIAKLRVKLVAKTSDGIWQETANPAYSPVLRKPNRYQNRIQFYESWVLSKLQRGNAYILKQRDGRGVVTALYVLDPNRVTVLVADDGSVFYDLRADNISGVESDRIGVPASEIIHDRFNCFFHPLVGLSPIYANGVASVVGLNIQNNSARFFGNNSQPGGVLTAPGPIGKETAERLKEKWEENFSGANVGKVAVLGDGLKYEPMSVTAVDAQLIEQLKWTAEVICSTYHVPPYKIGIGQQPTYNNVQALNLEYYSQCLQVLIESIELCLDEGLKMADDMGTELDTDNLLRMDSVTQMDVIEKGKNTLTPNEARKRLDLPPVTGGNDVMRQQQDYSLAALAKRDAKDDPFGTAKPEPAPAVEPSAAEPQPEKAIHTDNVQRMFEVREAA